MRPDPTTARRECAALARWMNKMDERSPFPSTGGEYTAESFADWLFSETDGVLAFASPNGLTSTVYLVHGEHVSVFQHGHDDWDEAIRRARARFPGRAVRGLKIVTSHPGNCAPDTTNFTLDFEPLPDGRTGYEFVADRDYDLDEYDRILHEECLPSISQGVLLNLVGAPKPRGFAEPAALIDPREVRRLGTDGPPIALRVVLTRIHYYGVDSAPGPHASSAWEVTQRLRAAIG